MWSLLSRSFSFLGILLLSASLTGCATFLPPERSEGTWRGSQKRTYVKHPPEQSGTELTSDLAVVLEGLKGIGDVEVRERLRTKIVSLYEHTERTVFLEYALFRLSELAANDKLGSGEAADKRIQDMYVHTVDVAKSIEQVRVERAKLFDELSVYLAELDEIVGLINEEKLSEALNRFKEVLDRRADRSPTASAALRVVSSTQEMGRKKNEFQAEIERVKTQLRILGY